MTLYDDKHVLGGWYSHASRHYRESRYLPEAKRVNNNRKAMLDRTLSTRHDHWRLTFLSILVVAVSASLPYSNAFALPPDYSCIISTTTCVQRLVPQAHFTHLSLTSKDTNNDEDDNNNADAAARSRSDMTMNELISRRAEAIQVENERHRLEELNIQEFLKRKPRKLPYEAARKWIQANLGPNTKEEFLDLVENGNLRTPYIPKRPEEYYTETMEWISWEHFLTGIFDNEQPSNIRPQTGVFD